MFESYKTIQTERAYTHCIRLLSNTESIKEQVTSLIKVNEMRVKDGFKIIMYGISPDNIPEYIQKLKEMRRGALAEASEIRLFIAGPVQAGTIAGAILDYWIPVMLYTYDKSKYIYWGPLLKH